MSIGLKTAVNSVKQSFHQGNPINFHTIDASNNTTMTITNNNKGTDIT